MTGVAGLVSSNMGFVFASRNVAVMAAFTGAGHNRVIHTANPSPAESGMTKLTGITGVDMITVLALGGRAVMTGETATGYSAVVKPGHMPANSGVAIVTTIITTNMVDGFTGGIGIVMTAVAHHWGTLKLTFVVTLIALNVAMLTGQGKSSFEMVEFITLGQDEVHQ
jgi:hypothetical protein